MDMDELKKLANDAIEDYFKGIDSIVDGIVYKIIKENKIEDEDDIDYLKAKVRHCILKCD